MNAEELFKELQEKYVHSTECYSSGEFSHCKAVLLPGALNLIKSVLKEDQPKAEKLRCSK